ncbi:MAG: nickel-dependent lactate racemase [bacterium]
MTRIRIPYHQTYEEAEIPDRQLRAVLVPSCFHGLGGGAPSLVQQQQCVERALDQPIDSPRLEVLAAGRKTVTIIVSDHTRPVPSRITLPLLLERLRLGNPGITVTILVATGCHRATSDKELRAKFGDHICDTERLVVHDCEDRDSLIHLGTFPSGGALWLNRHALETDLLISEGFIEPHFFAGFSGGRKSVMPGIAGRQTVLANHCARFIEDPRARTGNLEGNPIHGDMLFAADQARLAFILNVTLNPDKTISAAFAGHPEHAHLAGCAWLKEGVSLRAVPTEIVITSNGGYPLDQNLYQAVKGMTTAESCCKNGGTIIMVAGCSDGYGGEEFYRCLSGAKSPQALLDQVRRVPQEETQQDQWQYQILARILSNHRVILVTHFCDGPFIRAMHMEHAETLQEAVKMALDTAGPEAGITVIPDGVGVIVE